MKKLLALSLLALSGVVMAGGDDTGEAPKNKYYVMIDSGMEKDAYPSIANEYINANVTMGVKTPSKTEYSIKAGASLKDGSTSNTLSNNIELKIKQSFDIGTFFTPYVSVRLGEKFSSDTTHFTHYSFDAGIKLPLTEKLALDVGGRYRDSSNSPKDYRSTRVHAMALYDFDKHNTIGLRYTQSQAKVDEEERTGWRVHYQRNY